MKKLAAFVHVADESGDVHQFGPGDDVPEWVARKVTNPLAWATEDGKSEPEPAESTAPEVPIPPKGGPKATAEAWAAYAKAKGYEIEGDATRKEIIEALETDGIPTE